MELIEIKQKSLIPLPKGTGFYTILGVVAVILLIGYEHVQTLSHYVVMVKQHELG